MCFVLESLADLFKSGYSYLLIGIHRSVISPFHSNDVTFTMGNHPHVKSLLPGVGNLRPPIPLYRWNVEQVLKYLISWHPLHVLDTKIISLKLNMLLGLTDAKR